MTIAKYKLVGHKEEVLSLDCPKNNSNSQNNQLNEEKLFNFDKNFKFEEEELINKHILLSGSADGSARLWDIRLNNSSPSSIRSTHLFFSRNKKPVLVFPPLLFLLFYFIISV